LNAIAIDVLIISKTIFKLMNERKDSSEKELMKKKVIKGVTLAWLHWR
jgi:hypothetical protein